VLKQLQGFDSAQLNIHSPDPVLTPQGKRTTVSEWASDLGLFYSPTIIFFDEQGKEIIRVDSVIGFRRMRAVLAYIQSGAYRSGVTFQKYRRELWIKSLK
jgi:thioredoxin-related protein